MKHSISVIISKRPFTESLALACFERTVSSNNVKEILLSEGLCPSRQRNLAVKEASGEIVYFLDDDSIVSSVNFSIISDVLSDNRVAGVGGPSLTAKTDSLLQQTFGEALSSIFGAGRARSRYRKHGVRRHTDDSGLILCNLAVRRDIFLNLRGFNEQLYPNEENEFIDRVLNSGYSFVHDPEMSVERSQRETLAQFIRQMFTYGRGRAEQTSIAGFKHITSFVPLIFSVYVCLMPFSFFFFPLFIPMMIYLALNVFFSLKGVSSLQSFLKSLLLLFVFPIMHLANGAGLAVGFLTGVRRRDTVADNVVITRIAR